MYKEPRHAHEWSGTRYRALQQQLPIAACHGTEEQSIVYYAKELTRHMATPTTADWDAEGGQMLGRYAPISSKCGAKHKLLLFPLKAQFSEMPNCTALEFFLESVGRNNGYSGCIDVQRPRHAHEWSGTGRCERSSRQCRGPTRVGQIETSGHQLFVDPREKQQRVT